MTILARTIITLRPCSSARRPQMGATNPEAKAGKEKLTLSKVQHSQPLTPSP